MSYNKINLNDKNYNPNKIYRLTSADVVALNLKLAGIRPVNDNHVLKIKESLIKNGEDIKHMAPIEVNIIRKSDGTLSITDGQHRFQAYTQAWNEGFTGELPVIFTEYINDKIEQQVVIKKNTTSKNWGLKDFTTHRAKNDPNIKYLFSFCQEPSHTRLHGPKPIKGKTIYKKVNLRYAMSLLWGRNITKDMKSGNIAALSDRDKENAEKYYNELENFIETISRGNMPVNGSWYETLAAAWRSMRNDKYYGIAFDKFGIEKFCEGLLAKRYYMNGIYSENEISNGWESSLKQAIEEIKGFMKSHYNIIY